jgi:Protein of unknown function (DUF2950)
VVVVSAAVVVLAEQAEAAAVVAVAAKEDDNTMPKRARSRDPGTVLLWFGLLTISAAVVCSTVRGDEAKQRVFRSPASAAAALVEAARTDNMKEMAAILGPEGEDVVNSGDAVADNNAREAFTKRYDQMHRVAYNDRGQVTLYVGADNWPLPVPIVKKGGGWVFDTAEGKDELLFRRIGRNELFTIDVLEELADAQQDYATLQHKSSGQAQFAQRIFSEPGQKNGLFWPTAAGQPESPIGPLIADATAEGYQRDPRGKSAPFHGYYYKLLTGQGANAPGGTQEYIVDGKMTRGFAFLAYPAEYRDSGVMTFMIDKGGIIVEKDLGPNTEKLAPRISSFNPDSSWSELQEQK